MKRRVLFLALCFLLLPVYAPAQQQPVLLNPNTSPYLAAGWDMSTGSNAAYANNDPIGTFYDSSANTLNFTAAGSARPTCITSAINGYRCARFDGTVNTMTAGSAATWKWMHDGTFGWTLIAIIRQQDTGRTHYGTLFSTNGASASKTGINCAIDNRSGTPAYNRTNMSVTYGSGNIVSMSSADNPFNTGVWVMVIWEFRPKAVDPEDLNTATWNGMVTVDGARAISAANSATTFASGNPDWTATIGVLPAATPSLYSQFDVAGVWLFKRAFSRSDLKPYTDFLCRRFALSTINVIDTQSTYSAFPGCTRRKDGAILVSSRDGVQHTGDLADASVRFSGSSTGDAWSQKTLVFHSATYDSGTANLTTLSNGKILATTYLATTGGSPTTITNGLRYSISADGGKTWPAASTASDSFTSKVACSGRCLETTAGTVYWAIYGQNTGDTYWSVAVIKSTNFGSTWGSQVTVASGQTASKNYTEPTLFKLGSTYYCIFRNDTDNAITVCTSSDLTTWSAPSAILSGVSGRPATVVGANGHVYLFARLASTENSRAIARWFNGTTWSSGNYYFDPVAGFGCYASGFELKSGVIFLAYSREPGVLQTGTAPAFCQLVCRTITMANLESVP